MWEQCRISGTMEQYNKRDRYLYQFPGRQTWFICLSQPVKPADPEEAAALCQDDIEEMDFGGLHYYVTVKTFGDGEDASEHLLPVYKVYR